MAHTPTPWHVAGRVAEGYTITPVGHWGKGRIAIVNALPAVGNAVAGANAAFIVEAVNAYDDLKAKAALCDEAVEALRTLYRQAKDAELPGPIYLSIAERNQIRAVLTQAEALMKENVQGR